MSTGPSPISALWTLARLTLRRLRRGRAVWVSAIIALAPAAFAIIVGQRTHEGDGDVFALEQLVLAVLPAMFIASSIGEEIEDRTTTYLWSRPLPRWTVLGGKLLALAPLAVVLVAGGWVVAIQVGLHHLPPARTVIGLGAGALALSLVAAGIATLVPRHGMALSIVYVLFFDLPIGQIPASLQILSVTRQAQLIGGITSGSDAGSIVQPALALIVIAGLWLATGLWRMQRLES